MGRLGRWLDPPKIRERKRLIRAGVLPRPAPTVEVGIIVPLGCMTPAAALVVAGALALVRR